MGALSGSAWALGFVGGLVSLALVLGLLAPSPGGTTTMAGLDPLFGLAEADGGPARATGPLSAVWYAVFALPLFLYVPGNLGAGAPRAAGLIASLKGLRRHPGLLRFLAARLAYQDALLAVFAFGGIYGAGLLGWGTLELGLFGILLTVTGAIGAFLGGRLDDLFGARPVIAGAIVMCLVAVAMIFALEVPADPPTALFARPADWLFLAAGTLVGIAAGPAQAASRTYLARLAPPGELATYFGLFAFSGKAIAFTGPLLVALATNLGGTQRAGLIPIAALFVIGLAVLMTAPRDR
jgi:UMF1 family MFS transporter